ncbi:hypothetical protein IWW34DRAFT_634231 [Fusarium oxysporum f. sp. albedinis]|nr:hypothetical protein IWW34DRAFT_634231 [Fusarium oxysporum f. sp. albedinis]
MASNLFTELGCSNPIYPFVLLPEYRLIVCQTCQYACLAGETATHLSQRHANIDLEIRRRLVGEIRKIPGVLRSRTELPQLQYPPSTTEPIPYLAPPKLDVLKCRLCNNFNVRQLQAMQEHCSKSHSWVNPRAKGRPSKGLPSTDPLPWIEGVACQRFFPSREGSRWFQITLKAKRERRSELKAKMAPHKLRLESQNLTPEATAHLRQVIRREEKYRDVLNQPCITSRDTGSSELPSTSLWLDRTQWPSIYHNTRRDILRALTRVPDHHSLTADYILGQGARNSNLNLTSPRDDEQKLSCIMGAFESVIDRCENTVRCTSHNLLCWLLSSRLESRRENPFNLVAERSSEVRYRRIQKQFLAFVIRIYRMSNESLRDIVGVSIKSDVLPQLDDIWKHKIWDHIDTLEGIWPVAEMQGIPPTGSQSSHNACDSPGGDGGPFRKQTKWMTKRMMMMLKTGILTTTTAITMILDIEATPMRM